MSNLYTKHEGVLLKNYLLQKRVKVSVLCKDLGKSTNYIQAQYKKPILGRNVIKLLNQALGIDLAKELRLEGAFTSQALPDTGTDKTFIQLIKDHIILKTGLTSIGTVLHSTLPYPNPEFYAYNHNALVMIHKHIKPIIQFNPFGYNNTKLIWDYYIKLNKHIGYEKNISMPTILHKQK